jgi:heptosyltransferase-2
VSPAPRTSLGHLAITAPNWVGDVVMATPVLFAALEAAHVERLSIPCRAHLSGLLRGGPLEPCLRPHAGSREERAVLEDLAPDAVLILSNSLGAAWRAFRARVPLRAGSALAGRGPLLTHRVVPPARDGRRYPMPTAHLYRDVAGLVGLFPPSLHPRLDCSETDLEVARAELAEAGFEPGQPYFLCSPGAAYGSAKLWPPERYAAAVDAISERTGWPALLSGGPGEAALLEEVAGRCRSGARALSAESSRSGDGLARLRGVVRGARLMLVGDSGPRWVAAAFDVPCVSILGPSDPDLTATSLQRCEIVRIADLECSPCGRRDCLLGHHLCMRGIGVERVVEAAERALARAAAEAEPARAPTP